MTQPFIGMLLFIFLIIPPIARFFESIMILHMHMQMPLFILSGFLMYPFLREKAPNFFLEWNKNGKPGLLLFLLIIVYWTIPRTMDDALQNYLVEWFKFVSLTFFAGIPLRDSWSKVPSSAKQWLFVLILVLFTVMGVLYILSPVQLCNNYLLVEQVTLGWGFITMGICIMIYLIQKWFINPGDYE
ncbi:hypothetical protein [Gracilibacillus dipsosauri]|uniref:Uncharacterized protein n=1 Tax=Gracilibacillus dipsosauri TaxID=178340 RepID=A0A317KVT3_9BACI|nr:hypothetical protein [Gracilibacillus dipsosauri]PWU67621.1 hypothetical protein DLJ74_14270 [Gracilibacillus dipsosauri]